MVRVNHPPGGVETRLQKSPSREPKTVRVLKPPGGGSSILFDEPDGFHYPKNANLAPKSDSSKCSSTDSSGSSSPVPPAETVKNGNAIPEPKETSPLPSPTKVSEDKPVSSEPFPDISKVNISDTNGNASPPKVKTVEKKVESPEVKSPSENNTTPAATPTTNGAQPRKVIDHMKSRIFLQDDSQEYNSYKKSSPEVVKTEQTATPQRQRPPPGGFSTKLW